MGNHCIDFPPRQRRETVLALVEVALDLADQAGLTAAGIKLDQARLALTELDQRKSDAAP